MRIILAVALLLGLAVPALAVEQMSGQFVNTSVPMGGVTIYTGSGESSIADNVADNTYIISCLCNAEPVTPWPNPHTVAPHRFQVFRNGVQIFDDFGATYTVTRGNDPDCPLVNGVQVGCQTNVVITGSTVIGTYTVTFSNPHLDSLGRLSYDFTLTAQPNVIGGGQGGGDDPPIIHH